MADFIVIRNLKSPKNDVYITGDVPEDNIDYSLMVDVSLAAVVEKKGTGEEVGDRTYIFKPVGAIRLIDINKHADLYDEVGTPTLPLEGKTEGV